MNQIVIDPGYAGRGNACGAFEDGRLTCVWFEIVTSTPRTVATLPAKSFSEYKFEAGFADEIIVERPQQDARSARIPPAILMRLAWEGALLAGAFAGRDGARIIDYTPSEWKGSEPKPVNHKRLWKVLDDDERAVLGGDETRVAIEAACEKGALKRWGIAGAACYPKAFDTHNLLDVAAIGCFHLGRLEKT